ncbi:alpha amylase C-terminal domain-containing protein, partial [Fournierella sp.]|uniref:alpha amylase C-terminal domain-containing protein n=1 Tax=Allofournierella sp. TaxID=1940256 RepID=UPI0025BEA4A3
FNPIQRVDYQMGVPNPGTYKELLNSDDVKYGGGGVHNPAKRTRKKPMHGFDQSIQLTLPPLSTVYLAVPEAKAQPKKTADKKTAEKKTTGKKPAAQKPAAKKSAAAKTAKTAAAGTKQARKPAASKKAAPKEK